MDTQPRQQSGTQEWSRDQLIQTATTPLHAIVSPSLPIPLTDVPVATATNKQFVKRVIPIAIVLGLAVVLYFTWHTSTPQSNTQSIIPQSFSSKNKANNALDSSTTTSGSIQVYIVGAVSHPGVYKLASNARMYDLLQAAGGPSPDANLVAINVAARLNDGQEIYVTRIGETPPTTMGSGTGGPTTGAMNTGQLVNINTASAYHMTSLEYLDVRRKNLLLHFTY